MSACYWQLTAGELLEGYARRDFSPTEVLEDCIGRIEQYDPALRAYLAVNHEDARQAAKAAERAWACEGEKPLLCGVPVSVKDTIEMQGMPTTYGSLAFKNNYQDDSEIVLRLRDAGAVILGKTNTSEFALLPAVRNRLREPGCNPWNLERTCGGSSGGAAAAVAAGLGPLAVGTDSGGSIRLPAAYTGIFGLKPTYQRIPTVQQWRAAPGRSHNGPLARTVRDAALLMQALAGFDARDPESRVEPAAHYLDFDSSMPGVGRVAVALRMGSSELADDGARSALSGVASLLSDIGYELHDDCPPLPTERHELAPGVWGYSGDHYAAAEALIPGFWEKHADDLTDYARPIYEAGQTALAWQYRRLLRQTQAYRERVAAWFQSYDFVLTPIAAAAPRLDADYAGRAPSSLEFLAPFSTTRNPAAAVTVGFHSDGLPRAVQVVGRLGDDLGVLRLAAAIEAARPFASRWPPLVLAKNGR